MSELVSLNDKCSWFTRFTKKVSYGAGLPATSIAALVAILVWAACGPIFHFSDTWQLVINTSTTIITFLMVFLIQNTQNRDSAAIHLKLDELIRSLDAAHNSLMDLEELEQKELEIIRSKYRKLAAEARKNLRADGDNFEIFAQKGVGED